LTNVVKQCGNGKERTKSSKAQLTWKKKGGFACSETDRLRALAELLAEDKREM